MEDHQCQNHTGHTEKMKMLEHDCIDIKANTRLIVAGQHEIRERVAAVEASSKSAHHRLDSMEKLTESIITLAGEVREGSMNTRTILDRMERHDGAIDTHDQRIDKLENAPGIIAMKGWIFVGGFVVTAVLAFMLGKVGL